MIVAAGITFAVLVLALIIVMLLRRQLREKYATLWLLIGLALLVISIFPGLLLQLTHILGVEVPANLIFALSIVLLVGVSLHLSWELSRAEDEIRRLAEDVAINRAEIEALLRRVRDLESPGSSTSSADDHHRSR
ncbi:DUF2304 domain-containing protein [Microbacterium sp. PRF11]|uniref:DUF2304 domain-containing protein n=1 Tax=Microbacterium sp. PRF11 TaxID=2962593 RepID=UPI002882A1F5|nr:DUF2304 domain-containing protein [Microbacterium sp. PRF11]MDT0115774.1 DUF2304 domain-containing protein [Microbacterium sp. PRF11]